MRRPRSAAGPIPAGGDRAGTVAADPAGPRHLLATHPDLKESHDPDPDDAELDRIEEASARFPYRCFAFDQFGPLRAFTIRILAERRTTTDDRLWVPASDEVGDPGSIRRMHVTLNLPPAQDRSPQ